MNKDYTIETIDGITVVRFHQKPDFNDICSAIDDISKEYPSPLRLWDLSCGVDLTATELEQMAKYAKTKFLTPSKAALVAPSDLAFGLSRIHEVYRQDDFVVENVFRTEQEARDWLKS